MMQARFLVAGLLPATIIMLQACTGSWREPVDLYPEDICTLCKMAISDRHFASEIVTAGEVLKFDDIGCMRHYRGMRAELKDLQVFYVDYTTGTWVAEELAVVVSSGVSTPMGSGLVAFADSAAARAFLTNYPVNRSGK